MTLDQQEAQDIVARIRPLLAGHHPAVQGAALADLLAIWLAGHSAEVRETLLTAHLATVQKLIPVNAKWIDRYRERM